jgi:hypothetical protein
MMDACGEDVGLISLSWDKRIQLRHTTFSDMFNVGKCRISYSATNIHLETDYRGITYVACFTKKEYEDAIKE